MTVSLTAERLRSLLHYERGTGTFTWLQSRGGGVRPGFIAGRTSRRGYRQISIGKRRFSAHRLAWLYVYGRWPAEQIDHKNGVRTDNRLSNLREANNSQNGANRRALRGAKGVTRLQSGKWQAQITVNGHYKYLGCFASFDDAHDVYWRAAKENFGDFARAA